MPAEEQEAPGVTITCGPENVAHFNARLRAEAPEAMALAKALRERGMIDGLRGAKIGPLGAFPGGVQPALSAEAEKRVAGLDWDRRHGGSK